MNFDNIGQLFTAQTLQQYTFASKNVETLQLLSSKTFLKDSMSLFCTYESLNLLHEHFPAEVVDTLYCTLIIIRVEKFITKISIDAKYIYDEVLMKLLNQREILLLEKEQLISTLLKK